MKRVSAVMIGMVLVLSVLTTAHATSYTFTPHGYNCRGINDAGTIVGYYLDGKGWHGFSEETAGVYTTLDYPGISGYTFVYGISSNGVIVGYYRDDKGSDYGFSKTGEVYRSLDYPQATGVNKDGTIVGIIYDKTGYERGFYLLNGTTYAPIDYPGALSTSPTGINDAGTIVGLYEDAIGNFHGFSMRGGTYASIDYPGAIRTVAYGINKAGTIVGSYTNSNTEGSHGFSFDGTTYAPIDHPGAIVGWAMGTVVLGVNDAGVIVGYYNGSSYFVGTPDEPPAHTLTLTKSGKGTGSVTSNPSGIDCGSTCAANYDSGTSVLLTAHGDAGTSVIWSGGCAATTGNGTAASTCSVTMNSNMTLNAAFIKDIDNKVWIDGTTDYYPSLQAAYDAGAASCTLKARALELAPLAFTLDKGKIVNLEGGYDGTYSGNSGGNTTMNGVLTLKNGSLTLEKLIIK
jgi:hypothetical protein